MKKYRKEVLIVRRRYNVIIFIIAIALVIGAIVVAVISLVKGNNNFSMIDMIKNIVKYETMQKEYRYERGDFNNKTISKK